MPHLVLSHSMERNGKFIGLKIMIMTYNIILKCVMTMTKESMINVSIFVIKGIICIFNVFFLIICYNMHSYRV